jgi:nanoRNase/pAp phosphatase (c-di-AMP/oligoRNAs hydrolase)
LAAEGRAGKFPFLAPDKIRTAAVVCHRNADADAYLSAYAISYLLKQSAPRCEVDIITPGGMTALTTRLRKRFEHRVLEESSKDYDLYVAVDVGDAELLKEWREKMERSGGVKVLVDHHPLRDRAPYDRALVDEKATSAAEVVFGLFQGLKVTPTPEVAQALLEAIMFDSSHLAIAGPGGLRAVVALLDAGGDVAVARRELRSEPDYGEVLAKLKGAQRLKIYRMGDWVGASSLVGSFQAHVARSLVYLGADVAVVAGETEGETRVSLRSTQLFADATGVELGTQVASVVAEMNGGHGGGHATAASFTVGIGEEEAVAKTMERVAEVVLADLTVVD